MAVRRTHAELIEATKLKLEELQAKAEKAGETEKLTKQEKLDALRETKAKRTETHEAKIAKLDDAFDEAIAKIDEKITALELELGIESAPANDNVGAEA